MLRRVRRWLLLCGTALLALVPAAAGAPPSVTVTASATVGLAPFMVTLTANGDAASYRWDFGDGTAGDGATVQHVYAQAGDWTPTVTATAATGETAQASVAIRSYRLELSADKRVARYRARVVFHGRSTPAIVRQPVTLLRSGIAVAHARTRADGTFAVRTRALVPGPWAVRFAGLTTPGQTGFRLIPQLTTRVAGSGLVGKPLAIVARVRPRSAGRLQIRVTRRGAVVADRTSAGASARVAVPTNRRGVLRVRVTVLANDGYVRLAHVLHPAVDFPRVRYGDRGASVAELTSRLARLHYAVPTTAQFDSRVLDAVYAFQKVQRLPRTGAVDARVWQRLASPRVASPRYSSPASHLEVNKPLQVLFVVRGGRIASIVPVSTAGIAGYYTPVGRFAVYRKVPGFDPSPLGVLYDPLYFTGGYAIHGNPSVPPYPASHGCVRVPMWVASQLYATVPYGESVYVY
jgi:lipoprotein-anchoring transpeptidase ErfK/SrfK